MSGAAGALRLLAGLALLGTGCAETGGAEGLAQQVADLEALVRAQRGRLAELEAQAGQLPEDRRLALVGSSRDRSIYVDGRTYTTSESFLGCVDHIWLLICALLVFFMQAGFSILEAGSCRLRNVQNVLMKNVLDVLVSTVAWYIFGWSFAFSGPYVLGLKENGFIGFEQFAGHHFVLTRADGQLEPSTDLVRWVSSWAYCCVAATIATNGIAERSSSTGYIIFTMFFSSFIFPFVVAWTWGRGWLADENFYDYGGSGMVHMTGGIAALVGAAIAGPRTGRFDGQSTKSRMKEVPAEFDAQSAPLVALGTFILWFGWYGYLFGLTGEMNTMEKGMQAAHIGMNASIAASTGGIFAYGCGLAMKRTDISVFCNGVLAGLVSVSASAPSIEAGTAFGLGAGGAVVYIAASSLLRILRIDDPVDSFGVHGACGIWGVFMAPLVDWGQGFNTFHGWLGFRCLPQPTGACEEGVMSKAFVGNLAEIFAILGWVGGMSCIVFVLLKVTKCLRDDEKQSWDETHHVPPRGFDLEDIMPRTSL